MSHIAKSVNHAVTPLYLITPSSEAAHSIARARPWARLAWLTGAATLVAACGSSSQKGFGASGNGGEIAELGDGGAADSAIGADAACATSKTPTRVLPGAVLIVLDGSYSMTEEPDGSRPEFNEPTKWDISVEAIKALVNGLPSGLKLGLSMYPTSDSCGAPTPQVAIEDIRITRQVVVSALPGEPFGSGNTPTTPAINGAQAVLRAASGVGARTIVFLSDGAPNGCGSSTSSVASAVEAAQKNGVRTFVVGIAGSPENDFSHLAVLGGTKCSPNCVDKCVADLFSNPVNCCHYQTSSGNFQADLKAALTEIAAQIKTDCVYPVPGATGSTDPNRINVVTTAGGIESIAPQTPAGTNTGWEYTDANKNAVLLKGDTCKNVVADAASKVEILLGCATVIR